MASVGDGHKSSADHFVRRIAEGSVDQPVRVLSEIVEHLMMEVAGLEHAVDVVPPVDFFEHGVQIALHGGGQKRWIETAGDRPVPKIHPHFFKFHEVELVLDRDVHIAGIVGQLVNIGVHGCIQRIVAQKPCEIGEHLFGISSPGHFDQKVGRFLFMHDGHPFVNAVPQGHGIEAIGGQRIRPQQPYPIYFPIDPTC